MISDEENRNSIAHALNLFSRLVESIENIEDHLEETADVLHNIGLKLKEGIATFPQSE